MLEGLSNDFRLAVCCGGAGYMVRGSKSYASTNLTTPAYASTIKEKDAAALTLLKMFIRPSAGPGILRRMGRTDFAPAYGAVRGKLVRPLEQLGV